MRSTLCILLSGSAAALVPLAGSAAGEEKQQALAVLEFRSSLEQEDGQRVDAAALAEMVRAIARGDLPRAQIAGREEAVAAAAEAPKECGDDCEIEIGRDLGADLVVSGELFRIGPT